MDTTVSDTPVSTPVSYSTRFIFPESGDYPLTLQSIKARHPNTSFAAEPTAEQLKELGYFVVAPTAQPEGDVVTELAPVLNADGTYEQAYGFRAFNADELAQKLMTRQADINNDIQNLKTKALEIGAPIDFGAPYGVQHVQLRDGDRANVVGLRISADSAIAAGSTAMMGIRTYENKFVPLTPVQMQELSWKVLAAYQEVMTNGWHFEDLVSAATSLADLPALPADLSPTQQAITPTPTEAPTAAP